MTMQCDIQVRTRRQERDMDGYVEVHICVQSHRTHQNPRASGCEYRKIEIDSRSCASNVTSNLKKFNKRSST